MKEIVDYGKVFKVLVEETKQYILNNDIKAMILGISGGIDSTVVAAICHEVSKETGIPLIGRSLPTKYNKEGETTTADLVGNAFCTDYKVFNMDLPYRKFAYDITFFEEYIETSGPFDFDKKIPKQTSIANGNIQARLRMIYLYNLASINKGIVMDTDNLTENNLGYFTIHGDVGDFNPIGCLWKTEVFKLADWLFNAYKNNVYKNKDYIYLIKAEAMWASLQLKPTAGLGITDSDLEELGAESYDQVDFILREILAWKKLVLPESINFKNFMDDQQISNIQIEIIKNVAKRHFASEFKRNHLPIKISRENIIQNGIKK